jgi:hypothetical protein
MKKPFFLLSIVGLFLLSCKKDWSCNCEIISADTGEVIKINENIPDVKKGDAEAICENKEIEFNQLSQDPQFLKVPNSAKCQIGKN